jgi:dTDP-4-dehydrorhamnose reductase
MKILVTGAQGQLGTEIVRQLSGPHEVVALSHRDLDITDHEAVMRAVSPSGANALVNCAAYNDVDGAEDRPLDALNINAFAVRSLARAAAEADAVLVHYSTDFVFDGEGSRPYVETDPPNPRSMYSLSKLLGEWFAADAPRHYVLRVESLFGPPGAGRHRQSSIDRIIAAIEEGREAPVFVDRTASPGYVVDIAAATHAMLEGAPAYGLYHCVNSGHATWKELAEAGARVLGRTPRLRAVSVSEVTLKAKRPKFAALSNAKLAAAGIPMPTWESALERHLAPRVATKSS